MPDEITAEQVGAVQFRANVGKIGTDERDHSLGMRLTIFQEDWPAFTLMLKYYTRNVAVTILPLPEDE